MDRLLELFSPHPLKPGLSREDEWATTITLFLLPVAQFCVVLMADLGTRLSVALLLLPLAFAAPGYLATRRAQRWRRAPLTVGCVLMCIVGGAAAALVDVLVLAS